MMCNAQCTLASINSSCKPLHKKPTLTHSITSQKMDNISVTFTPAAPLEEIIFGMAFLTVFGFLQLPLEDVGGNPVPTILFKDKPSFFHAFLLSLTFAFTGAGITITLREKHPKIARLSRCLAIASTVSAAGILTWLVLPSCLELVVQTWNHLFCS